MAELTVQNTLITGIQKATLVAAAASGDTFDNDGKTWIEVNNGGAGAITVTALGQKSLPISTSADKAMSVPAGEIWLMGPFPVGIYNTDGANEVSITYSGVTSVTVGAFTVNDLYN